MKVQTITTFDRGKYCDALEKMYNGYDVKRVDTHTELAVEVIVILFIILQLCFSMIKKHHKNNVMFPHLLAHI